MPKNPQTERAKATIWQITGKRYPHLEAAFENFDQGALDDLTRFVRDIQSEMMGVRQRAIREPWRR